MFWKKKAMINPSPGREEKEIVLPDSHPRCDLCRYIKDGTRHGDMLLLSDSMQREIVVITVERYELDVFNKMMSLGGHNE